MAVLTIESDEDLEHFADLLESLDRLGRELTPEEKALEELLSGLIEGYDEPIELPDHVPMGKGLAV